MVLKGKTFENKIIEEAVINVETIKQYDRVWLINALLDIEDDVSLSVEQIFE